MPRWIFYCIGLLEALYIAGVFTWMIRKDRQSAEQMPQNEGKA